MIRLPGEIKKKFFFFKLLPFALYDPDFEKVEVAYCFGLVHPFVCPFQIVMVLKFHKLNSWPVFFSLNYLPLWSFVPFKRSE